LYIEFKRIHSLLQCIQIMSLVSVKMTKIYVFCLFICSFIHLFIYLVSMPQHPKRGEVKDADAELFAKYKQSKQV
jgi:hypothetical protein